MLQMPAESGWRTTYHKNEKETIVNQTQKRYALERVREIERTSLTHIGKIFDKEISSIPSAPDWMAQIRLGRAKLKRYVCYDTELKKAFDYVSDSVSQRKRRTASEKKTRETERIRRIAVLLRDQIVLGDSDAAIVRIKEFEKMAEKYQPAKTSGDNDDEE